MRLVYLSGPISLGGTCSDEQIAGFTAQFAKAEKRARSLGWSVINPCNLAPEESWEDYMRHGMRAVADCDCVAVLPRWSESRGSALEVFVATQLRIPIIAISELGSA